MKSVIKLLGVSSCCLAIVITSAKAEPMLLADAELDRVAAGSCLVGTTNCNDTPGYGLFVGFVGPLRYNPNVGIPVEPPGCETGACQPSPFLLPRLEPITPIGFPSILTLFPPTPGLFGFSDPNYCGPACDPGPVFAQ